MPKLSLNAKRNKKVKVSLKQFVFLISAAFLSIQALASLWAHQNVGNQRGAVTTNGPTSQQHTLQQYYDEEQPDILLSRLPSWIQSYLAWHRQVRQQFPGRALFEHPDAPPLLIRMCFGLCGGLNDRIAQLDWDLYLANATGRVLLLHWHRPVPIEHFLVPNSYLDWRVPPDVPHFFPENAAEVIAGLVSRVNMRKVKTTMGEMFDGMPEDHPTDQFWATQFDEALQRDLLSTKNRTRIMRHKLLGHLAPPGELERRIGGPVPPLGRLFCLFFQPSPGVAQAYHQARTNLLSSSTSSPSGMSYYALHLRVRHPKAAAGHVIGKDGDHPADKTGLPWEGESKARAIATAEAAITCARHHFWHTTATPLYLCADSNDLVQHMTEHVPGIVSRPDIGRENAHIDKQKGRVPEAYYATFVDILLAANAECIAFGVGNYGLLASRLSGTQCRVRYQKEAWGEHPLEGIPECQLAATASASPQLTA